MELNINSPAYFKEQYGIDDDVYKFCQQAYMYFKDKEYSEILHIIGIIPIVVPNDLYVDEKWKESCTWRCYITVVLQYESELILMHIITRAVKRKSG